MKYDWLSPEEITEGIQRTITSIEGLNRLLEFYRAGGGLPKDPSARYELIGSYEKMKAKLEKDLDDLQKAGSSK